MAEPKRKWWQIILGIIIVLNIFLWATGRLYLYKALIYNYVNIDDLNLFYTRQVTASNGVPWPNGKDFNAKSLAPELRNALETYESVAFLVIKDDSIRYEEYWDSYGPGSLSNSFSMAKSIVSILVGIAVDEGKISSLDQSVCKYLPEFCSPENERLTVRHLLMMSSGLNWDEGYTSLFGQVTRSYYDSNLKSQMLGLKVVDEPGKEWNYMSANTQLLAFIVEKATGMSSSEYASQKLWIPIQAEKNAQWSLDQKEGSEKAFCCFYSNARDFARIGKLFLQKGKWNGKQVVSEAYVNAAISPAPITENGTPVSIYGYQWWLTNSRNKNVFYARGILGQYIFVIPDLNIIFVRLGHKRGEKGTDGQLLDVPVYIDQVLKMYGNL
ncbi:MAG: serine hydrolase [Bacteroidetes bacterium]|nr:serine hydrolase [Bacteroidota bacterium]